MVEKKTQVVTSVKGRRRSRKASASSLQSPEAPPEATVSADDAGMLIEETSVEVPMHPAAVQEPSELLLSKTRLGLLETSRSERGESDSSAKRGLSALSALLPRLGAVSQLSDSRESLLRRYQELGQDSEVRSDDRSRELIHEESMLSQVSQWLTMGEQDE